MSNKILLAIFGFNVAMFLCWMLSGFFMDPALASGGTLALYYLGSAVVSAVAAAVGYFVGGMIS